MKLSNLVFAAALATSAQAADKTFWALTGAAYGATVADIEASQRCINRGTCKEVNPLFRGRSRGSIYPIAVGLTSIYTLSGYALKRAGWKYWWIMPAAMIGVHGVAATWALHF